MFFFFNDTATTEIYTYGHTLSLHDALPISQLPRREKSVGGRGEGSAVSRKPARWWAMRPRIWPRASITAETPVGVERMMGIPSSRARRRAWARCWTGPQLPNQASLEGLKRKSGRLALSTTWPEKMIS